MPVLEGEGGIQPRVLVPAKAYAPLQTQARVGVRLRQAEDPQPPPQPAGVEDRIVEADRANLDVRLDGTGPDPQPAAARVLEPQVQTAQVARGDRPPAQPRRPLPDERRLGIPGVDLGDPDEAIALDLGRPVLDHVAAAAAVGRAFPDHPQTRSELPCRVGPHDLQRVWAITQLQSLDRR